MQPLFILAGSAVTVDSFAGKHALVLYEFQEFCGFLVVDRVQHLGSTVRPQTSCIPLWFEERPAQAAH